MKANYGARFLPGLNEANAVPLNAKGEKIAAMVWAEAQRQVEIEKKYITESVLCSVLVALHERYHWRGPTLEKVYKDAVTLIAGWRHDLREDHARREFGQTSEEIVALMMRLKDAGLDVARLEDTCEYDPDTGEVYWR